MKAALAKAGGPKTHSGFPLYIFPPTSTHTHTNTMNSFSAKAVCAHCLMGHAHIRSDFEHLAALSVLLVAMLCSSRNIYLGHRPISMGLHAITVNGMLLRNTMHGIRYGCGVCCGV